MKKSIALLYTIVLLASLQVCAQWTKVSVLSFSGPSGQDTAKNCAAITGNMANLYASTTKGLLVSANNGSTWTNLTAGNSTTQANDDVSCVAFVNDGTNNLLMIGTKDKIYSSADNGVNWTEKYTGIKPGTQIKVIAQKGSKLIAAAQTTSGGGGIYVSSNYGASWDSSNTGLSNKRVNCMLVDGSNIFVGSGDGVFLSTDDGAHWTLKSTGLPASPFIYKIVKSGNTLLAGSASGSGVYKSSDNGNTWDTSRTGVPSGFCQVFDMLTVNSSVYFSQSGATGIQPIYSSTDAGGSWTPDTIGLLTSSYYPTIGVNGSGTHLFAFRASTGELYRKGISTGLTSAVARGHLKVYPNPATDVINIETEDLNNKTMLSVFDLSGKELIKVEGQHSVDLRDLNAGTYLLLLTGENTLYRQVFIKQ